MVKNIIIVGGLLLLGGFGYYLFVLRDTTTDTITTSTVNIATVAEQEAFLRSLQELKSIDLDTSILNDSRFNQLVDSGAVLQEVPVGRSNPFQLTN